MLLLFATSTANARVLQNVRRKNMPERKSEIAFTLTGWFSGRDVDALARCLPQREHLLPKRGEPGRSFNGIRWTKKALAWLDGCQVGKCKFNFPASDVRQLLMGRSIEEKKSIYYDLVHKLTWRYKKGRKRERIEAHQLRRDACSSHDLFHWLLNGPLKPSDRVIWRKHFGGKTMHPTLKTLKLAQWKTGQHRCIGTTLLFSDHYYYDSVDLLQLTPMGPERIAFRLQVRERFDVFKSFWARRFRGRIRARISQRKTEMLQKRVTRCLGSLQASKN
ncbi:MAG: hypothetical protein JRH20_11075 [Deltaproteobacteria bacterium]|nr:hypothetical protein [Deltaproteobacteria bacterium]